MSWLIFASTSVGFFAMLNLLQRKIAINTKYPRATAVVFNFWAAIIAIIIFVISGSYKHINFPKESIAWVFLLIASLAYALFERGRFIVAKLLDASVLTIISNLGVVMAFIFSLLLYSETLSVGKVVGAGLIVIALILISLAKNIRKISLKGIIIALVIFTFLALGWTLDKKGAIYFNPVTYNIFVWTIPLIFIYIPYVKFSEIKYEAKIASWKVVLLAGLNVVGYLLQLKALEIADATKVIPIVQTSTLLTVILGIFLLGETEHKYRKIISAIIALVGVYLLIASH